MFRVACFVFRYAREARNTQHETTVMRRYRFSLIILALACLALGGIFRAPLRRLAFEVTGEEETLGQARG